MSTFLHPLGITLAGRHREPAFAASWQTAKADAEDSRRSAMAGRDVTDRLSGWGHNYYCPDHSGALDFDESRPNLHRCAEFDHEVAGEQYDSGWAYVRNYRLLGHLAASALSAAVSGAAEDADRATEFLTGLAEVYPELPLHGTKVGQGRLFAQSLEEAVAATSLARSFALADWLSVEQRRLVTDRLFRPMVQVIQSQWMNRTHNIEVWHLAGLASLAVVLDDRDLAHTTLHREHGFSDQIADGLLPDGWWFEGSPGYHFYMLTAVLNAVESYQALDIDSDTTESLERMLLTPVETGRNDLTMPAFNDSSLVTAVPPGFASHADLYFRGARLCRSERLDRFLTSRPAAGFDRASSTYLTYGRPVTEPTAAPPDEWPVRRRDMLPDSGYAVLRQPDAHRGTGPDTSVYLKFGPHGGGHGQPDKLEIDLMIDGSRVIADPGTAMYTNPIHRPWFVQTWSHSTVVIDRISQPPIRGELLGHRQVAPDAFGFVDARVAFGTEADTEGVNVLWHMDDPAPVAAYAGVTIRRVLAMQPPELGDYLLDLVLVDVPHRRSIDLITHVRGELTAPTGRPATDRMLLPRFDHVRRAENPTGHTDYRLTDHGRPWTRWHTGADELLTAVTPSNPTHQQCATTIERVVGCRALFAAALPLGSIELGDLHTTDSGTIELTAAGQRHRWDLASESPSERSGNVATEPPLRFTTRAAVST